MNGLEYEPERGVRCTACFDIRMEVKHKRKSLSLSLFVLSYFPLLSLSLLSLKCMYIFWNVGHSGVRGGSWLSMLHHHQCHFSLEGRRPGLFLTLSCLSRLPMAMIFPTKFPDTPAELTDDIMCI